MIKRSLPSLFSKLMLAVLLMSGYPAWAQLNPNNLTQYTEADGLPGSEVHKVLVDKFGYIWVGTINGLARYDGYEFKRYFSNPNDSASIQGLNVWSLFEDSKGQIWVGSGPSHLNVYNPATHAFRNYNYANLIDHPANVELGINTMAEDHKGRIYFGVMTNYGEAISPGLLYLDEKDDSVKKFTSPNKQPQFNVYRMTSDKEGNIWLLSYNGLFKIDTSGQLHEIRILNDAFRKNRENPDDLTIDKEGHLWIVTEVSNLYDFNLRDSALTINSPGKPFAPTSFNGIAIDPDDNVWLGTDKGLIKFNTRAKHFEHFQSESKKQLEKSFLGNLCFDSFGSLWISTLDKGLLKYEEKALFSSYSYNKDDKNSLTAGWANTISETQDGKVWIATTGPTAASGINMLDLQANTVHPITYRSMLPKLFQVSSMFDLSPGELLMNTNLGSYQYSIKSNSIKKINLPGVPDTVFFTQIYKDSKDNMWLCTLKGLFKKSKDAETFIRYDLSKIPGSDAGSNEITKLLESPKHGLWLATNNGLFLFNPATGNIERHGFDKKAGDVFITQDINSFYEDKDGILWVGLWQGGLSRYTVETKKITTYTRNDGLQSMCIQGILSDEKNGALWLSTFEGLSRMDLKTKQFNNFSIADGIQSQLFADGGYLKTAGGLLVFGGSNGITVFNPDEINKKSTPPKVLLTDLKLFNKSISPGKNSILKDPIYDTKEIALNYDQNNISIEFLAIHYSNPSKNKYTYKLENYDNEWRDIGNQRIAFYPNLPPGKYLFRVKASNNNGVWNEEGATLSITVSPPWWKTTWAYILYALLLISIVFAVDRYFRQRLIEKERERNRTRELEQAREIEKAYHELKTTQTQLIQSEKMASLGELTAGIAHEIQNPLNFVNNFSEVNTELIDELKEEIEKGNLVEVKTIADSIKENEQKINHHGKRADAIVKGMLQHSRSSTGGKEPTDINALADEYLRLAYHGLRAKDKNFSAEIKTDFDDSIGNIQIIAQDTGRVLLNLYNNAFYAVGEKKKSANGNYKPTVTVTTKKVGHDVYIGVKDNGSGIPGKVVDKIFQPFFTTKPTGQGTGLGLSLSYDITKGNGGEIKVETKEGEGSEFIVRLPIA